MHKMHKKMRISILDEICDLEVSQHPDHDVLGMKTNTAFKIITDTSKKKSAIVQMPEHEEK